MKNLEKYLINFDDLKIGDILYCLMFGNVEVVGIEDNIHKEFAIRVRDVDGNTVIYTRKGLYLKQAKYPTLLKSNPFLDLKEESRTIEVRTNISKNIWEEKELIAMSQKGVIVYDGIQVSSYAFSEWREIQRKELTEKEEIELLKKRIQKLESLNEKF